MRSDSMTIASQVNRQLPRVTLTAEEARVLIDLVGTYMADRCDDDGVSYAIVPRRHERTLEFALRKLEAAAQINREEYEYWPPEECDGDADGEVWQI